MLLLAGRFILGEPGEIIDVAPPFGGSVGQFPRVLQGGLGLIPVGPALRLQQPAQAGPGVTRQVRDGAQLRPDGIEVDVVAKRTQSTVRIHDEALVTALKEVARSLRIRLNRVEKVPCSQRIPSTRLAPGVVTARW